METKHDILIQNKRDILIIMTRESLAGIPYGYREIYRIKTSGKYHSLENIYPEYHEFHECNYIITEDEDAGLEFYQHFYGEKVISSHGYSNLSNFGGPDCLLIGD